LKKKLSCQCPYGHDFGTFNYKKAAIVEVRLHIERVHKDFLPFGITDAEILSLLKEGRTHKKTKSCFKQFLLNLHYV